MPTPAILQHMEDVTSSNAISKSVTLPSVSGVGTLFVVATLTNNTTSGTSFPVTSVGGTLPVQNWFKAGGYYAAFGMDTTLTYFYGWTSVASGASPTVIPSGSSGTAYFNVGVTEWSNVPPGSAVVFAGRDSGGGNGSSFAAIATAPAQPILAVSMFTDNVGTLATGVTGATLSNAMAITSQAYNTAPTASGTNTHTFAYPSGQAASAMAIFSPGVPGHQQRTFVPRARASFF